MRYLVAKQEEQQREPRQLLHHQQSYKNLPGCDYFHRHNSNHDDIRCEWCHSGYCECYGDAKEQEQRETNCPCSGTEDCMIECGQLEREAL